MERLTKKKKAVFSIILIVLVLALLEGGARLIPLFRMNAGILIADPVLHHALRPNMDVVDAARSIPYRLKTNSLSMPEESEVPEQKQEDSLRIFYVGDSNTQGVVEYDQRISTLVGKKLSGLCKDRKIQVINTGTSSYSIILYQLLIKKKLMVFDPDLIVINVDMTDVPNDQFYRQFAVKSSDGTIEAIQPGDISTAYRYRMTPQGWIKFETSFTPYEWLVQNTAFFHFLDKFIAQAAMNLEIDRDGYGAGYGPANWLAENWTEDIEKNVGWSMGVLEETVRYLIDHGVSVMVTSVPHFYQFEGKQSKKPHKALATAVPAPAVYVNSFEAIVSRYDRQEIQALYWKEDATHFNKKGYEVWADIHADAIRWNLPNLLPKCRQ